MLYKGRLISFIALLIIANVPSKQFIQGLNSKCNISPVGNGDIAAIICSFGEDISKLRREFQIIHYGKDHKETTVLICLWHFENPECIINKMYKFRGNITDTVQVDIDKSNEEYTGDYVCNDLSTEPGNYESCKFSPEVSKWTTVPVSISTLTTMVLKRPDMVGESGDMKTTLYTVSVTLAVIVVILIIVIASGIIIYRQKLTKKLKGDPQNETGETETLVMSKKNQSVNQGKSNPDDNMSIENKSGESNHDDTCQPRTNQEKSNHDDYISTEIRFINQKNE